MKKIYINAMFAGLGLLALSSCGDDYLNTTPKGSLAAGVSMSGEDAELELNGCYDGYQQAYCYDGANFQVASDLMSDDCFAGGGMGDNTDLMAIDNFDKGYVASSNLMESRWVAYYACINRCNSLIQSEGSITWTGNDDENDKDSEEQKKEKQRNNVIGQAKAIRALCYFDLTRLYGEVPLLTATSVAKVKESPVADIYEQIVSDLKDAASMIHFGAYKDDTWKSSKNGLISEWAAKALLARVYLFYTGYYGQQLQAVTEAEVKAGLEDIIQNGNFKLVDKFARLWPAASRQASADGSHAWSTDDYAGESNSEILFNLKFDSNLSQGTNQNGAVPLISLRNTTFAPYATGWGVCTVNPQLYSTYVEGDSRRDASIINITKEGIANSDKFNSSNDWREYTGYSIKKYSATGFNDGTRWIEVENAGAGADWQYKESQDYVVMRYADVLLMAAEMGCQNAQSDFDQVRDRAFGDASHRKVLSREAIFEERRLEFAFEGIRYWDMLRFKGLEGTATLLGKQNGVQISNGGNTAYMSFDTGKFLETKGLMRKPSNQITLMGSDYLSQNPGW